MLGRLQSAAKMRCVGSADHHRGWDAARRPAQEGGEGAEGLVGGLGGVCPGGASVWAELGPQNSEVAVVEVGGEIADLAVERLDHVHAGEEGRELHAGEKVGDGMAQQLPRLFSVCS